MFGLSATFEYFDFGHALFPFLRIAILKCGVVIQTQETVTASVLNDKPKQNDKHLYLSANVFSTAVLIGGTVNTVTSIAKPT